MNKSENTNTTELLFSYGTLQNTSVQLSTFGRVLDGFADELVGYQLNMLTINNPDVLALSRESQHPIAVLSSNHTVSGVVLQISYDELRRCDEYEVDDYQRVRAKLASGKQAWVYVQADKSDIISV